MRRFFFLRLAIVFLILVILMTGLCTLAFWLAQLSYNRLGVPLQALPVVFIVCIGLGFLGLLFIGRTLVRVSRPVSDLMSAVGRVEAGDYSARADERGPSEVRALIRAFNAMAERLEISETQRRNLLADVTHELRTPLTIIQGNLEGLLDGVYPLDKTHLAATLEETHMLSHLVEDLRTLALAESGTLQLHREPTDFKDLATSTVSSFQSQAEAKGIEISTGFPDQMPILDLDPVRIQEVLANLLANALRYTPSGGQVSVQGNIDQAGNKLVISVSDTGSGISPEVMPHIFDRFNKSSDSGGSGLGLAIAKNLVAAHGGEIWAKSNEAGAAGTTIGFSLPLE
jgi:signal transduction histidine kinase